MLGGVFNRSDAAKVLRTLPFTSNQDVAAFVEKVGAISPAEIVKILSEIGELSTKQPAAHKLRCEALLAVTLNNPSPDLFVPFLRTLRGADETLAMSLMAALPHVNHVPAHGELVELLGAPSPHVRSAAGELLKQLGGRSALELATKRALDPAFHGRMEAMNVFLVRAAQHALPLLSAVLAAGKPQEKIQALRHLADKTRLARDVEGALEVARPALDDADDLVVARAITTVGELVDEQFWDLCERSTFGRGAEVVRAFLIQAAKRPGETAASIMRDRFREGPRAIRLIVIDAIEGHGTDAVFGTLMEALAGRDLAIRGRAAHAVSEMARAGRVDAAHAIVWLLRSKDVNVRRIAAEIATRVDDKDGSLAPRLLRFLRDEDWWVRERVLDALVELDTPAITKHLVKDYLSDESGVVRRFAVAALQRMGDKRALGALVRTAQDDPDWLVAELAVEAVGTLGDDRAAAYLVDLLGRRRELRVACIVSLRKLKAGEALPAVAELVQDEDPDVRAAAIGMLEELDDGSHALWVKSCEDDPSATVRTAAGRLLRRFNMQRVEAGADVDARSLDALLAHALAKEADDLFLVAGRPPLVKSHGKLRPLGSSIVTEEQIRALIEGQLSPTQQVQFQNGVEVDFSYQHASRGVRFRANLFRQVSGLAVVFRTVKKDIISLEDLGVPPIVRSFAAYPHGLVLVGGPTGAGKSTTLAAMVDYINRTQRRHIVTIEDPVEVVHEQAQSLLTQREIGAHTRSFKAALRSVLRQDPDVILVGELRDLDTISFAVSAAETGHLVFGTVHTTSADATIERLVGAFPGRQQPQVRGMLAESLRAVTCQYLLPTPEGGRVPAVEVMINNDAIHSLIRKGKAFQIPTIIATSRDQGMQLMDSELIRLAKAKRVAVEEAYAKAVDRRSFEAALGLPPSEPDKPAPAEPGPTSTLASTAPQTIARPTYTPGGKR
jgi:twitching motility protein PilT